MRFTLWSFGYTLRRQLALPGLLAFAILIAAVGFGFALDRQDGAERETLLAIEHTKEHLRHRAGEPSYAVQLDGAGSTLPPAAQIPDILDRLHGLAELLKLPLPQSTYAWIAASGTEPAAYEISMTLKARYAAVKPFLMMALNAIPSLAIRDLTMRRASPEQPDLDIQVRMALFVQEPH